MPTILTHILMTQKDKEVTTTWHLFWKKCINCQATNQPLPKTPTKSFSSVSWSRLGHSMSTQPISAAVPAGVSKRLGVWLLSNSCEHPISQVHQKGTGRNYRAKCKWYQAEANMTWDEPWNLTWQRPVVRCRRSSSRFFLHLWCCGILSCDSLSTSCSICLVMYWEHMKILLQVLQSHVERNWYRDNSRLSQSYPGKWEAAGKTSTKTTTSRPPSTKWLWKIQGSIPSPSKS